MTVNRVTGQGCWNDDECEGGYRLVTDNYVEAVAPRRPAPFPELGPRPPAGTAGPLLDEWDRRNAINVRHHMLEASRRTAAAASSYPCPTCNPDQFIRWQRGEWPYPNRTGSTPIPNEAPDDDAGLFADLATPYRDGVDF